MIYTAATQFMPPWLFWALAVAAFLIIVNGDFIRRAPDVLIGLVLTVMFVVAIMVFITGGV